MGRTARPTFFQLSTPIARSDEWGFRKALDEAALPLCPAGARPGQCIKQEGQTLGRPGSPLHRDSPTAAQVGGVRLPPPRTRTQKHPGLAAQERAWAPSLPRQLPWSGLGGPFQHLGRVWLCSQALGKHKSPLQH